MECKACELNNIGVRLLMEGRFEEANDSFSEAAQMVKRCIHVGNEVVALRSGETIQEKFTTMAIPEAVYANNVHDPGCSNSFVYRRAVLLPDDDVGTPTIEIISAVILFNMALTFHSRSAFVTHPERFLKRARRCYRLLLSIRCQSWVPALTPTFLIVVLNNLAEVLFHLGQYDAMMKVQQDLTIVLDQVGCTPRADQQFMDHNEVHGLMWNLLILKIPSGAAAA